MNWKERQSGTQRLKVWPAKQRMANEYTPTSRVHERNPDGTCDYYDFQPQY